MEHTPKNTAYNIYLYWENKGNSKRPEYLNRCLRTLKKHNDNVVLVTPDSITKYVPNDKINSRIWKLSKIAQRSDYFRFLLIHHNGGLWLDFDTICLGNFSELLAKLNEYEAVIHSEQFFAARSGLFAPVIQEIDDKLNRAITSKYIMKQRFKKALNRTKLFKVSDEINPFKWTEIGMDVLKKHIGVLHSYQIPEEIFQPKTAYNWEKVNNRKIFSKTIEIHQFIQEKQLIVKLYNSMYSEEDKDVLKDNDDILFNKLINYSLMSQ